MARDIKSSTLPAGVQADLEALVLDGFPLPTGMTRGREPREFVDFRTARAGCRPLASALWVDLAHAGWSSASSAIKSSISDLAGHRVILDHAPRHFGVTL